MNAGILYHPAGSSDALRWGASAAIIVAVHTGLIGLGLAWHNQSPPPGVAIPAIMVDMAPAAASAAPEPQPMDVAPGPEMQEADEPPPPPEPPKPDLQQEQMPPTPVQDKPAVEAPPEAKPEPEPAKIEPEKPKPVQEKPKPVRPPAPRTSAAPKAERRAALATAATAGAAAAAALPSYRDRLAAHLQRYKQYPSGAKAAGEQGVAMLSFTVSRSGQVLASRLAGSSGHGALDAETLAMIRRAQPLPAFPPEMTQASMSFTVPIRFSIR